MIYIQDENQMIAYAAEIASALKVGDVVLLSGDLGAGKSFFARALIRHILNDPDLDVPSPTFTLVQSYEGVTYDILHYDLYRLKDPEEVLELGWEDGLGQSLCIVEWPDRLGYLTPQKAINILIEFGDKEGERHVTQR